MLDAKGTAKRMLSQYKNSSYSPEERVTDHAFAYEAHEAGRKYWIEVLQTIYKLREGNPDERKATPKG
jgi:hypothetical protein